MKKKKNKNNTILKILIILVILVALTLLIFSSYKIYLWYHDNEEIDVQMEKIEEVVEVKETQDTEKVELVNPPAEVDKSDPYWDYIKVSLIDVDFENLLIQNNETVGWIQVGGTNINYPFVQTTDNKYYLTHQFDKKYNAAGWVFMDYRNNSKQYDYNTIIYAHGRLNRTMFGSLRNVVKESWYGNKDNHIVKISTETENTLWQVFSTYRIKTTSDYLQIDFSSDEEYSSFLTMLKDRSVYDYNVQLSPTDKIITLSTCHNDTDKIVLHAKLIKREEKS